MSNESTMQVPKVSGNIISTAFDIYTQLLKNGKSLNREVCSLCAKYVGNNVVRPRKHFHGSEFGKCFKNVQLDKLNPKPKSEDEFKNIFLADGHLHEITTIALLEQSFKISHKDEEKIIERIVSVADTKETIKVVLHTDAILTFVTSNEKFIIELKSVKDWAWKNLVQKETIPKQYYGQCQLYMEAYNIPNALLFFKNRMSSEIYRPFVIPKNEEYINQRFSYLAGIQYSINNGILVPREYTNKKCDACKFCDHFKVCWEGE